MKIVLCSALFPPDIAAPAPYVKELARRLAQKNEVTAVVYGGFPERVEGARIIAVSKRRPLPLRLISFMLALWRAARRADILFVENGASAELPALLVQWLVRTPLFVHLGDRTAKKYFYHKLLLRRAAGVITESPLERPELFPFAPRPEAALTAYEQSWSDHLRALEEKFAHAK